MSWLLMASGRSGTEEAEAVTHSKLNRNTVESAGRTQLLSLNPNQYKDCYLCFSRTVFKVTLQFDFFCIQ